MKIILTILISIVAAAVAVLLLCGRDAAPLVAGYWVINTILCVVNARLAFKGEKHDGK